MTVKPWEDPKPISEAPNDRPILAWCDHEADPYVEDEVKGRLTLYAAHYEGLGHAETGWHIIEWGGGFSDCEEDGGAYLPDWWFVRGSEFEVAANPICFYEMPPEREKTDVG